MGFISDGPSPSCTIQSEVSDQIQFKEHITVTAGADMLMASANRWYGKESQVLAPFDEATAATLRQRLGEAITHSLMPTYVYTYPPRQCYRPLPSTIDDTFVSAALSETPENLNLYLHVPFCRQICHYCNLFTVVGELDLMEEYIDALAKELQSYAQILGSQRVRTVYFGGGTPSLLSNEQLARVFDVIEKNFPGFKQTCDEICIEAAPDTITRNRAHLFKSLGINRVNVGIQTFSDDELRGIGRKHTSDVCREALDVLRDAQIGNVCVDLINGLFGQTRHAWENSVRELVQVHPETICLYPLTVRPGTGYHGIRESLYDCTEIYSRYDSVRPILLDNGYRQETHIRFVIPGRGGYKQKEYHWEGATVLGVGAGARTYAPRIHFRNGYSTRNRSGILGNYLKNVADHGHSRVDGFLLDNEEQLRREFALNLHRLDTGKFSRFYGLPFQRIFPTQVCALEEEGLLVVEAGKVEFTEKGMKYRDLISRLFFSARVVDLEADYTYDD